MDENDKAWEGEIESAAEHDHPLTNEEIVDRIEPGYDRTALWIVGILIAMTIGIVAWAVIYIGPPLSQYLEAKLIPTPTEVSTAMYVTDLLADEVLLEEFCAENVGRCIDEVCPEPEPLICPEFVCPGCDPCPVEPGMEITDDRALIDHYLAQADKALVDMEASITMMDQLSVIMRSFGDARSQQKKAFDDPQWQTLFDSMDTKVESIRSTLDNTWPPPPYNSCNPLLDVHGRLLLAFANIDEARDDFNKAVRIKDPDQIAYFYTNHTDDARQNMHNARLGIAMLR